MFFVVFFYSELFIRTENTSLQDRFLDCETSVYIACKKCGQVNIFQHLQVLSPVILFVERKETFIFSDESYEE